MSPQFLNVGVHADPGKRGRYFRTESAHGKVFVIYSIAEDIACLLLHAATVSSSAPLEPYLHCILNVPDHK